MQILSGGRVWLEYGELIPVFCDCGNIYQPEEGSKYSICKSCGKSNDHSVDTSEVVAVDAKTLDFKASD